MKSYREILEQDQDGAVAVDLFGRGFPECVYDHDRHDPENPGLGMMFLNLFRFDGAIAANGFSSIFDQHIVPWELEAHERFMAEIGADDFLRHFRRCRIIYFGSESLPASYEEWEERGSSVIWDDPDGPESQEFDKEADMAEAEFYGRNISPADYIDLHVKLGRYMRKVLPSILRPEDLGD